MGGEYQILIANIKSLSRRRSWDLLRGVVLGKRGGWIKRAVESRVGVVGG